MSIGRAAIKKDPRGHPGIYSCHTILLVHHSHSPDSTILMFGIPFIRARVKAIGAIGSSMTGTPPAEERRRREVPHML